MGVDVKSILSVTEEVFNDFISKHVLITKIMNVDNGQEVCYYSSNPPSVENLVAVRKTINNSHEYYAETNYEKAKESMTKMTTENNQFLLSLCDAIYQAQRNAEEEYEREKFGDNPPVRLVVMREDKVRVEIRKENGGHNEPHLHIIHSDKIDASLSLKSFHVLAGNIDGRALKHVLRTLIPVQAKLFAIWETLNEQENSIGAEKLISNLFG
jgi:hypothetical protein